MFRFARASTGIEASKPFCAKGGGRPITSSAVQPSRRSAGAFHEQRRPSSVERAHRNGRSGERCQIHKSTIYQLPPESSSSSRPSAGNGSEKRNPWARSQPSARKPSSCSASSTPSAAAVSPRARAMCMIAVATGEPSPFGLEIRHERPVDLNDVDGESMQVVERAEAGAEVVDRQFDAELLEAHEQVERGVAFVD